MFHALDAIVEVVVSVWPRTLNGWLIATLGSGFVWYAGFAIVNGPRDRVALWGLAVFAASAVFLGVRLWLQFGRGKPTTQS